MYRAITVGLVVVTLLGPIWIANAESVYPQGPDHFNVVQVSLPRFRLSANEGVGEFRCSIDGGALVSVKTPFVWAMNINNGEGGVTLNSSIVVDGAVLTSSDLSFFDRFIAVGIPIEGAKSINAWAPFQIVVMVYIYNESDMRKVRSLKFSTKDLTISPVK